MHYIWSNCLPLHRWRDVCKTSKQASPIIIVTVMKSPLSVSRQLDVFSFPSWTNFLYGRRKTWYFFLLSHITLIELLANKGLHSQCLYSSRRLLYIWTSSYYLHSICWDHYIEEKKHTLINLCFLYIFHLRHIRGLYYGLIFEPELSRKKNCFGQNVKIVKWTHHARTNQWNRESRDSFHRLRIYRLLNLL